MLDILKKNELDKELGLLSSKWSIQNQYLVAIFEFNNFNDAIKLDEASS